MLLGNKLPRQAEEEPISIAFSACGWDQCWRDAVKPGCDACLPNMRAWQRLDGASLAWPKLCFDVVAMSCDFLPADAASMV